MLKIAASDYDGTLFRNDIISDVDVRGVRLWRTAGHKFGVITGRDYGMLLPQLRYYGIGFDFAVCNNGGIIHSSTGKVLYQSRIDPDVLLALSKEPCVQPSVHFAFSSVDCTYLCHESEGSWIMREAKRWSFPIISIDESKISMLEKVYQFSLGFPTEEEARACSELLNKKYGDRIHAYPNRGSVDITPCGVSKRQGIYELLRVMKWEGAEIFPIGDETNDLPMIEEFDGYTVDTARDVIKEKAAESFSSVGAMLENFV